MNLHRLVGNVTFGGFVAGLIAAYMYMGAKKEEERSYYDWMGFVGNHDRRRRAVVPAVYGLSVCL